jgi:tripartite ATP-independent transporter DctP family solute receptor
MRRYNWALSIVVLSLALLLDWSGENRVAAQQPAKEAPKTSAKVLDLAYVNNSDLTHMAYEWMSKEIHQRSNGTLQIRYHPGTLLTKEAEIIDAVKSGNIAMGTPVGAASSLIPEMGVFMVPYLVRNYNQAYTMFNGEIGKQLADLIERKYKLRVLIYMDMGFRHFWYNKRPINKPEDLKGLKLRVQQGKVFADTVNGLGASAVPMGWTEVIPAVQQGVVDGADLPVANIFNLKAYEVSKYASLTFHNYSPTVTVINPDIWKGLSPDQQKMLQDVAMLAQKRMRNDIESVDSLAGAKKLLEPVKMIVNQADLEAFRRVAEKNIWPQYKKQYPEMWEKIVNTK